jgi:uncharacterized membrane protein
VPSETAIVFGIPVPSADPVLLAVVRFHILVGIVCVAAGAFAMLSRNGQGWHSTFGTLYYWCLAVVVVSASALSVMRWSDDYHLFLSEPSLWLVRQWRGRPSGAVGAIGSDITEMGASYVLMLTAFYVDNGRNLPIWKELPQTAFWLLPAALGIPLIVRALLRHPLVQRPGAAM